MTDANSAANVRICEAKWDQKRSRYGQSEPFYSCTSCSSPEESATTTTQSASVCSAVDAEINAFTSWQQMISRHRVYRPMHNVHLNTSAKLDDFL